MPFDAEALLKRALDQGDDLALLKERVQEKMRSRRTAVDRILHHLQDSFTFVQGQNTVGSIIFNVPDGAGFECVRLMLLPEIRAITIDVATTGPDDLVFRPTCFSSAGSQVILNSACDALVEFSYMTPDGKDRAYQNKPWYAAQAFSSPMNINKRTYNALLPQFIANYAQYSANQYGRGLEFEPFLDVKPGSTINMQITPLFSGTMQSNPPGDGRLYEYRIRGVIEGYKRVVRR